MCPSLNPGGLYPTVVGTTGGWKLPLIDKLPVKLWLSDVESPHNVASVKVKFDAVICVADNLVKYCPSTTVSNVLNGKLCLWFPLENSELLPANAVSLIACGSFSDGANVAPAKPPLTFICPVDVISVDSTLLAFNLSPPCISTPLRVNLI